MVRLMIVTAAALVLAVVASAGSAVSDSQVAKKLVAARGDVPSVWSRLAPGRSGPAAGCLARADRAITARARSAFGTPHTGVDSVATLFKTQADAKRYYNALVVRIPRCLQRVLRDAPRPPFAMGPVRMLALPHYGDQSGAWLLPFSAQPKNAHFDWVVVRTGRGVLADLFVFYVGWRDEGLSSRQAENRLVSRALGRVSPGA